MIDHRRQLAQHVPRRDPNDCDPARIQPFRAASVVFDGFGLGVGFTIDLDRPAGVLAIEVQDVGTNGVLAAKADSVQAPAPDLAPKQHLRQGHFTAQLAGAGDLGA